MIRSIAVFAVAIFALAAGAQAGTQSYHPLKLKLKGAAQSGDTDLSIETGTVKNKQVLQQCGDGETKDREIFAVQTCPEPGLEIVILDTSAKPATVVDSIGGISFEGGGVVKTIGEEVQRAIALGYVELDCPGVSVNLYASFDLDFKDGCARSGKSDAILGAVQVEGITDPIVIRKGKVTVKKPSDMEVLVPAIN